MARNHPFSLYNPGLLPAEVLLAEFTARRGLLTRLLEILRQNNAGEPPQHCLLIGPRGMGKTTTLWAVAHSIHRDHALAAEWHPVVFDEESRSIGDLADFWLKCLRFFSFDERDGSGARRADRLLDEAPEDLEDKAREAFLEMLRGINRRAVLLVDNINEIFGSLQDAAMLRRFRAFLMKSDRLCIIGTATRQFDEVAKVDQAFFEFFRIFNLEPLKLEEMRTMLLDLSDEREEAQVRAAVEERPQNIEILHTLTGGNPRLVKTFYRLLAEGMAGDVRQELERLVDDYTPYLKAILDALPAQQQRVIDAIALAWNPVEAGVIARATRVPSNQVSAQLNALIKQGLLMESPGGTQKKKLYMLADRFSNIHYLMRHGRVARSRFDWFILTLFSLMPERAGDELGKVAARTLLSGSDGETRLLTQASERLGDAQSLSQMAKRMLRELWESDSLDKLDDCLTPAAMRERLSPTEHWLYEFFSAVPKEIRCELGFQPESRAWLGKIFASGSAPDLWAPLEQPWKEAAEKNPRDPAQWRRLARLFHRCLRKYEKAEEAYRKALALDPQDAMQWYNLGNLLQGHLKRYEEAEEAYRKALALDPQDAMPWYNLGNLLQGHLKRYEEAEEAYRKAIALDPQFTWPWNNLGNLLKDHLKRYEEAEEAYRKFITLDPQDAMPWNNLGNLLQGHLKRYEEAEEAYRKAITLNSQDAMPWYNLGNLLKGHLKRYEEAEEAYRKAIALDPQYSKPWNNLGNLLQEHLKRYEEAEEAYRKAIAMEPQSPRPWNGLGIVFSENFHRYEEAENAYRRSIALDPKFGRPWAGLSKVLARKGEVAMTEARECAQKAILLEPSYRFGRWQFEQVCFDSLEALSAVLPSLTAWCLKHPGEEAVFAFAVDVWIQHARLGSPAESLRLMESLASWEPFETVRDAFLAHENKEHLNRIAPERASATLRILERLKPEKAKSK